MLTEHFGTGRALTSWTAEFTWPGAPGKARERISQWTGVLEPRALEFRIDEDGATTVTVTVEAAALLEAQDLVRQIADDFLGPEAALKRLTATETPT